MENIILQKTRYLKALMLTMLVGFFAFGASAQTFTDPGSFNSGQPAYAGEEAEFTYDANNDWPAGTTFILWDDVDFDNRIDENETVFGTSQEADVVETINFNWPESVTQLRFGGFSGDTFLADTENFSVQSGEVTAVGTNDNNFLYFFGKASLRQATTTAYDLNTTAPVRVDVNLSSFGLDVDNPVEVLYSTDGFTTAGTVLQDINTDTEFDATGTYTFELPAGAKAATTSLRVRQKGTIDYGTAKTWRLNGINLTIGDEYTLINPPGLGYNAGQVINTPFIQINDALDAGGVSETVFYPGDEVTVVAELQNVDLTNKSFVAIATNTITGNEYVLETQTTPVKDNGTKVINVNGFIPSEIEYDNPTNWEFNLRAYEGAEPQFGINTFVDFTAILPDGFEQFGGIQNGDGLVFDEAAERSVTTPAFDITSTDGIVTFNIGRKNDVISPAGTDIIVEYTTDGTTYTELVSIPLNDLPFQGDGLAAIDFDAWPAGVVSTSTQFRFRQEANNGADLDAWVLQDLTLINASNIVPNSTINEGEYFVDIFRPDITLDNIDVGGDGLAFPMEDYTFTYTINEGAFPAGTGATVYFDRDNNIDPSNDIVVGSVADVTTASIGFTVPPIEAGDYRLYIVANGENYSSVPLAVYDLELSIDNITYENPVTIAGDENGKPGEGITVEYSLLGTQGASAELMLSVYDDNVGEYVMIGASTTINGTITATLPTTIDYTNNPSLQLTLGNGGIYSDSPFDVSVFNADIEGDPIPQELFESIVGTSNNLTNPDSFTSPGERSATSIPFDMSYGGYFAIEVDHDFGAFNGTATIRLEFSSNGTDWEEVDDITLTNGGLGFVSYQLPSEQWTPTAQFRVIYNENGEFAENENSIQFNIIQIFTPEFLESTAVTAPFNLSRPSLSVNAFNDNAFALGEEVTVNYNAVGFEAGVEFAAVVKQNNEFYIAGTSADQGAGSITATMPVVLPIDQDAPGAPYVFEVVPYIPAAAGDSLRIGQTVNVEQEEDFLIIEGDRLPNDFNDFDMDRTGDRLILTRAFDLSSAESAVLYFDFNNFGYGNFDANANKNTVPRLEVSTDGGATFQTIPVEDLAPGEMAMYDEGLLYEQDFYTVEVPAQYLTAATHFRWSQPLNLGEDQNPWSVEDIQLEINQGNDVPSYAYENINNPVNPITLNAPNLNNYLWVQSDLQDPVFNGETFDYSWNVISGIDPGVLDAFPAGTTFDFYLYNANAGEYVLNPETANPYVIASSNALGTAQAEVPFFVTNGNYQVRLAASVDNAGEPYYYIGGETNGTQVGNLDVFLRAVELSINGDPNANVYAGQEVSFSLALENDETNTAPVADLFANLIMETDAGDLILATQQGLGDITVTLPTQFNSVFNGVGDFRVRLTENAPQGEVGTFINESELSNLEADISNFTSELFSDYIDAEMSGNAQVIQTRKFSKEEFNNIYDIEWDFQVTGVAGTTNIKWEYSTDNGQSWNYLSDDNYSNGFYDEVYSNVLGTFDENEMEANGFIFRWIQENPEGTFWVDDLDMNFDGQSFDEFNMEAYPANFTKGNAVSNDVDFPNNSGRRTIATKTFTSAELENVTTFGFDLTFNQLPNQLTANQYLVFEFSTDGGASYTELATYPEMDAEATLAGERFIYDVTTAMKDSGVKFRWRQEENKGNITLDNISFLFGQELPFDYIDEYQFVNLQALLITSIPDEVCLSDDITLSYELRGAFGSDDVIDVIYEDQFGTSNTLDTDFVLDAASGDLTFSLPSDVIESGANNRSFKFTLLANVLQSNGFFASYAGQTSENSTEIIAPVALDADFSVSSQRLCSPSDVMVTINDVQDFFIYQVINAVSGAPIGDPLVFDPEMGTNMINLGAITDEVRLGLEITAQSSTGTTCNTITSTVENDLTVIPEYALFNNNVAVAAGTAVDACGNTISLTASYYNSNGSQVNTGNVEWFRDDLNTPVSTNTTLSTFDRSGDYFARVTDGTCVYTTEAITVNVAARPDQPAITVASGDLVSCDENNEVVLEGPEGFATYVWDLDGTTLNANQRTITVSTAGTYQLQVSNASEANNCNLSNSSEPVILNTVSDDDVFIDITGFGQAQAGQVYDICDNNGTTINVTGAVGANANIRWFQDGAEYAANTNTNGSININVSGAYYAEVTAGQCTFTTPEVTFNVLEAPQDAPTITATGDLTFCDGQGSVVLEGPEGFAYYEWYRNGGAIGSGAVTNNNTLEVTQSGTYTLEVGNVSGDGAVPCLSPTSNTITVNTRTLPDVPRALVFDNSCGDGPVTFVLDDAFFSGVYNQVQSNVSYQLINAATDEPSGLAITGNGNGNTFLTSDVITEQTTFYIEATYADGSGCTVSYPETRAFTATPNNVTLEVEGAQLIASFNGNATVRWYRDGVLLTNETSNRITISDAAEYSVEVEYASGCVVTASSADIAAKVLGNQDAMAMKVVSYPNPTLSDVTLNVNSQYMGKHEVTVTSMTGQVMMQSSFEKSSFEAEHALDIANLQEGIYNVQIRHDGLSQNVRIIKK
ncbi:T9SS type A sorting domain-containing protein [Marivirga sp.]|uniref:T9SS type A sorting domain-containing protein n=1 Tax=Marivirga sp. TaxID=2018662 RepID=UPI0025F1CA59|nr:T9SS type A sorting domain-containing protein [Marivirga sp.]